MEKVVPLTTKDVAEIFGVDSSAVRRWVLKGQIKPSLRTPGGHLRFLPSDLDGFRAEEISA